MSDNERFRKILALAVNPGAHDGEAQAAFFKLRELVRQNPNLTEPPIPPEPATRRASAQMDSSSQWRLTQMPPFWLPITVSNLSERAYLLGLRSKFVFDFTESPTALDIRCDGADAACKAFDAFVKATVDWTNTQPADPTKA